MTIMKNKGIERPMLFSTEMVLAILEGRKTQTRRLVKMSADIKQRGCKSLDGAWVDTGFGDGQYLKVPGPDETCHRLYCPHGYTLERLWVREKAKLQSVCPGSWASLIYAAGNEMIEIKHPTSEPFSPTRWTPSIHMPHWACRIMLEITEVRVERLRRITESDAEAEGVGLRAFINGASRMTYRSSFACLWDEINGEKGPNSWNGNPFVWCLGFKRVKIK